MKFRICVILLIVSLFNIKAGDLEEMYKDPKTRQLSSKDFIGGAAPSVGDIPVGCAIHRWNAMDFDKPAFPNIDAWYARLSDRTTYQDHVMLPLS